MGLWEYKCCWSSIRILSHHCPQLERLGRSCPAGGAVSRIHAGMHQLPSQLPGTAMGSVTAPGGPQERTASATASHGCTQPVHGVSAGALTVRAAPTLRERMWTCAIWGSGNGDAGMLILQPRSMLVPAQWTPGRNSSGWCLLWKHI